MKPVDLIAIEAPLIEEGRIIEAGFASLRAVSFPPEMPEDQLQQHRSFFFAGARHLFHVLASCREERAEAVAALINAELERFGNEYAARHNIIGDQEGNA